MMCPGKEALLGSFNGQVFLVHLGAGGFERGPFESDIWGYP